MQKSKVSKHRYDPYKVLPLWGKADLGAMAMKGFYAFLKVPALLELHYLIV